MSGWTHRRTISDGVEVAVGASDTVLISVATSPLTLASGIISNLDGVDSLTVHWQTSWHTDNCGVLGVWDVYRFVQHRVAGGAVMPT